jgi:hypothetical protein
LTVGVSKSWTTGEGSAGLRWRSDLREAGVLVGGGGAAFLDEVRALRVPFACAVLGVAFAAAFAVGLGVDLGVGLDADLCSARAFRFGGSGVGAAGSRFTRDDLRTPFSKTVVGPWAEKDFQGGEAAREAERGVAEPSSRGRLDGRSASWALALRLWFAEGSGVAVACEVAWVVVCGDDARRPGLESRAAGVPGSIQTQASEREGMANLQWAAGVAAPWNRAAVELFCFPLQPAEKAESNVKVSGQTKSVGRVAACRVSDALAPPKAPPSRIRPSANHLAKHASLHCR